MAARRVILVSWALRDALQPYSSQIETCVQRPHRTSLYMFSARHPLLILRPRLLASRHRSGPPTVTCSSLLFLGSIACGMCDSMGDIPCYPHRVCTSTLLICITTSAPRWRRCCVYCRYAMKPNNALQFELTARPISTALHAAVFCTTPIYTARSSMNLLVLKGSITRSSLRFVSLSFSLGIASMYVSQHIKL